MNNPIRILLVDDSPYFLDVARDFLAMQDSLEVAGEVRDGTNALDQARALQPDVILLDLNLGAESGMKLIPLFKKTLPLTKIIALTMMEEKSYRAAALQAGADAFVNKTDMTKELISTIFNVAGSPEGGEHPSTAKTPDAGRLLANIVQTSDDAIFSKDLDGVILSWNKGAEQIYGYRADEVVGKSVAILIPSDLSDELSGILEKIRSGEAIHRLETRRVTKSGNEIFVSLTASPLRDENGAVIGASTIARDITERRRAEEALRESEIRFRQLANSLPQLVWTCQPDGPCDFLSQQWIEYTGIPEEAQLGFGWLEQLHPDDRERTVAAWNAAVAAGSDFQVEFRIRRSDGVYRWFDTRAVRLHDAAGRTVKWFGSNTDITERRRAEEALQKSEARLANILIHAAEAIVIVNEDGLIESFNLGAQKIFGYREDEIRGKPLDLLMPPQFAKLHLDYMRDFAVSDEPGRMMGRRGEITCVRKDGSEFLSEIGISKHREGGRVIFTAIVLDVTARKQAEGNLRASEERYRTLTEAAQDMITVVNREGRVEYTNTYAARQFGVAQQELIGKKLSDIFPEEIANRQQANLQEIFGGGESAYVEAPSVFGGQTLWLGTRLAPIRDEAGRVESVLVVSRDITERERAEEELRHSLEQTHRAHRSLQALNLAAQAAQRAHTPHAIYQAAGAEIKGMGFDLAILEYDADSRELSAVFNTYAQSVVRAAEKLSGVTAGHHRFRVIEGGYYERALTADKPVFFADASGLFAEALPPLLKLLAQPLGNLLGAKQGIYAALRVGGEPRGIMAVTGVELGEEDIPAVEALSSQISIALENARLYQEALDAAERRDTLYNHSQAMVRVGQDIEQIYAAAHHAAARLMPAEIFTVVLSDEERRELEGVYLFDKGERWPSMRAPAGKGFSSRVISSGEAILLNDLEETPVEAVHFGAKEQPRSLVAVPMRVGDRVFGAMSVQSYRANMYREEDRVLLEMLAAQVAVAIQNVRLYDRAQQEIAERRQAEEALRNSENHFRALIENGSDIISVLDAAGAIRYESPSIERSLGYRPEELVGRNVFELVHPDDLAHVMEVFARAIPTPGVVSETVEMRFQRKDGSWSVLEAIGQSMTDKSGELIGIVNSRDITKRKQAEEALRESEHRYGIIFDGVQEAIFVESPEGGILDVNASACAMFGYSRGEFLAKKVADLVPPDRSILSLDRNGNGGSSGEFIETVNIRANGEEFPVEVSGRTHVLDGKPAMLVVVRDITERKRAEIEIQKRNEDLSLLNTVNQAINRGESLSAVVALVSGGIEKMYDNHGATIYLVDAERRRLVNQNMAIPDDLVKKIETAVGIPIPRVELDLGSDHPFRRVFETKNIQALNDARSVRDHYVSFAETVTGIPPLARAAGKKAMPLVQQWVGAQAELLVPLVSNDEIIGVMDISNRVPFTDEDIRRMESIASQLTIAIRRRQAEEALGRSEEKYRGLFENVPDGVFRSAPDGSILAANPAFVSMLGYDSEREMIESVRALDLYADAGQSARFLSVIEADETTTNQEIVLKRRDGARLTFLENARAVRGEAGEVLYYEGVLTDISDRKRAEEETRLQLNRLKALRAIDIAIAGTMDLTLVFSVILEETISQLGADAADILLYDEKSRTLNFAAGSGFRTKALRETRLPLGEGYAGRVALGRHMARVSDLRSRTTDFLRSPSFSQEGFTEYFGLPLVAKGEIKGVLEVFLRKPSEPNPEWLDFLETLAGQAAIAIDNSTLFKNLQLSNIELERRVEARTADLNRANLELERANRAKNEFFAAMSHELRTPLNSILGLSESMIERGRNLPEGKQAEYLGVIRSNGDHLLALINDILDAAKIEAGKLEIDPDQVSVKEVCEASLNVIRDAARRKSISLEFVNPHPKAAVRADGQRLKQILVNLLANAVKFTPEGGAVSLEVKADEGREEMIFSVLDNGIGISSEDLPKLFAPFMQLESGLSRRREGTGLGLVIVQKLTELHGGSVRVESEPGRGSRFTVVLPWRDARSAAKSGDSA